MIFKSLKSIEQYLDRVPAFKESGPEGARMGLGAVRRFCRKLGNPQDQTAFIHVAGTNGKGTTCRYLSSIYQQAGYRCGMFISPHLLDFRERFTVNGEWISEEEMLLFFKGYQKEMEAENLTYFEICSCLAFWWFDYQQVDLAVIETGLGGRLDATNIVDPMVSVITSVGMDHQQLLGDSIEEISREKAGIIKPGRPVVAGTLENNAMQVIEEVADAEGSPVHGITELKPDFKDGEFTLTVEGETKHFQSGFAAPVNAQNIALAWKVGSLTGSRFPVDEKAFREGVKQVAERFPRSGCFEHLHPEFSWYFDGAHNFESLQALRETLSQYQSIDEWIVVFSLMRDKITPSLLNTFSDFKKKYYYSLDTKRAATYKEVSKLTNNLLPFPADLEKRQETLDQLKSEFVIFTGSIYFYEAVRQWLNA